MSENNIKKRAKNLRFLGIGICVGVALGFIVFKNIGVGLAFGVAIGLGLEKKRKEK